MRTCRPADCAPGALPETALQGQIPLADQLSGRSKQGQHEAIEVNERRGMLVAQVGGLEARWIEIYDISQDCRNPRFVSRFDSGQPQYHGLDVTEDGRTIYASNTFPDLPIRKALHVIDVSDMANPRLLTTWDPTEELPPNEYGIHDLALDQTGHRAYLGATQQLGTLPNPQTPTVVVLDTGDVQRRAQSPDLEVVGIARSQNFGHDVIPATIGGRPFIVSGGELPLNGPQYCPWAWGNLIDISDETQPTVTSTLQLEVNELANCPQTAQDQAGYSIHYGGVDDPADTQKAFFTWYMSGAADLRRAAAGREQPAVDREPERRAGGEEPGGRDGGRPRRDRGERTERVAEVRGDGADDASAVRDAGDLPFTGLHLALMGALAALLIGGGFALRRVAR